MIPRMLIPLITLALVVPTMASALTTDIIYRAFDGDIVDTTAGKVKIVRDAAYAGPGALLLEGLPGVDSLLDVPVELPCALGSVVDTRFLLEDGPLSGVANIVDLRRGLSDVVTVRSAGPDLIEVVGASGAPIQLPAAQGVWHDLHIETLSGVSRVSIDDGPPVTVPSNGVSVPDLLQSSVVDTTGPVRLLLDDLRVAPLLERFLDLFTTNTWTSNYPDPGEVAQLRTNTYHSAPSSMYIESRDANSNYGMGISHQLSVPMCMASRVVGLGTSAWFQLPAGQLWGNAGFALMHLMGGIPSEENNYDVPVIATVGDFNGDRRLDIRYPGQPRGYNENPDQTLIQTGHSIPFGGWHEIDILVRPNLSYIDIPTFEGLTNLPTLDTVFDVRIDGELVGTYPVHQNAGIVMAYMGTVYTRTWLSDNFRSYWDDFRVRLELVAPLCAETDRLYNSLTGELPLDRIWLDGDETLQALRVDAGDGWVDITETRRAILPLDEGRQDVLVEAVTSAGTVLRDVCTLVADTLDPRSELADLQGIPGENGWFTSPVEFTPDASDGSGTGVALLEGILDGGATRELLDTVHIEDEGVHTFQYRAEDRVGNVEAWNLRAFPIDLTPPTTTVRTPGGAPVDGAIVDALMIALDAQDTASGIAQTFYRLDGGAPMVYAEPFEVTAVGEHTLDVWSKDTAGHVESATRSIFWVDHAPPSIVADLPAARNGWLAAGEPIHLTASDDAQPIQTLRWRMDGGAWTTVGGPTASITTPSGDHTLEAQAFTPDGAASELLTIMFAADDGAPTLVVTSPSPGTILVPGVTVRSGSGHFVWAAAQDVTFAGTASDEGAGLARVQVYLDGTAVATSGLSSWSADLRPGSGLHRVDIVAEDALGYQTVETWSLWSAL